MGGLPGVGAGQELILDTDIGSDVDDELALAVLLGSPEVRLRLITTVYGDTTLRAQIASRIARLAGHSLRIVPGASKTTTEREIWWAGHEGKNFSDLELEHVDDRRGAADALEAAASDGADTTVLAIAPLTNLAHALSRTRFTEAVRELIVMGGDWTMHGAAEHNLKADPEAAGAVFSSPVPITAVGLDITKKVSLDRDDIRDMGSWGLLGRALQQETEQWLAFWDDQVDHPHDAVAAMVILRPDLFTFSPRGRVDVDTSSGDAVFQQGPNGNVRVVTGLDAEQVKAEILGRIRVACQGQDWPGGE